jgi:regulator of extracellular matrix RemA (YlzA/DUF370 family)
MKLHLLNVGFANFVFANRIVAIIAPGSAPVKRVKEVAKEKGLLVDATCGRKTRALLVMDSGHVVLSAINPDTIAGRIATKEGALSDLRACEEEEDAMDEEDETDFSDLKEEV